MPAAWVVAALAASALLLAALAGAWIYLTFFRRYRVHKAVYGSSEVEEEFRDVTGLNWPIPQKILTRKQFLASFNVFPAPDLKYERHKFPCEIWPDLGEVAYDEVFLLEGQPSARKDDVFIFVCPLACNTHVRCMRRSLYRLLKAGYRCYALVSRGNGGELLDPERQKIYLDECWNIQDMFEMVCYLAAQPGGLPPVHFCGHSLGAMRVAHFLAQVGKLIRKQADEARGAASPVRHDGDNALRHNWRGFDNAGTREVARLLQARLASCAILFPHYDCRQPFLSLLRAPRHVAWAIRPLVKQNEAAIRKYLTDSLMESEVAGRDPAKVDREVLARYVTQKVDSSLEDLYTRFTTMDQIDPVLTVPLTRQESVTDYYTTNVVTREELREIAGLTQVSSARALYFGVADDTLASDVFPHDYAEQGIEARVLGIQLNRGEHVGTVMSDGLDVGSYFVLRMAEAQLGPRNARGAGQAVAEPARGK